ncbi:MAG: hypothetical protein PHZ04_02350 [Patescibacteria group bacterium]|nr:hypothetical protein [Patescibacteria group bacterium]MDD5295030.1 hypothetical protein [Patescibacteria group bacterium]MDD5554156.1 hypothetical protein [Patescibacteria group bacterium]
MGVNSVNPPDGPKNSGKGKVDRLPEASGKSFQYELKLSFLTSSVKSAMAEGNKEAALSAFKTIFVLPGEIFDLAKRVFEGAPIFAAFVAKMAIDEIIAKLDLEEEKARELQRLAEEYARKPKKVQPI